jgi:hypothetical protein
LATGKRFDFAGKTLGNGSSKAVAAPVTLQAPELPFHDYQLEVFEMQRTPLGQTRLAAPAGQHDDCVIALALCLSALERPAATGFIFGPRLESYDGDI